MDEITLRRLSTLGSVGGSIFDYFLDQGVRKLNLFAES